MYGEFPVGDPQEFADFPVRLAQPAGLRRWVRPQVNFFFDGVPSFIKDNVAVVAAAKKAKDSGWDVRVLALRAPWSKTAGTDYTCSKAEAAGLRIVPLSVEMNGPETATKPLLLHELDVIWCDLETGGRVESMHAIVEIGAVRTDPSHRHVLDKFELKLWPADGFVVDHGASLINGFSNARWSANNAFEAREGLDKFLKWLPERFRFANYNANFDVRFLKYHAKVHGLPSMGIVGDLIDPLFTVRKTLKKTGVLPNAKLDTICEYYGIRSNDAHQALADAERARLVYLALLGKESTGEAVELTR
jgi:DNA polymerase III epsilon subunit-like protein